MRLQHWFGCVQLALICRHWQMPFWQLPLQHCAPSWQLLPIGEQVGASWHEPFAQLPEQHCVPEVQNWPNTPQADAQTPFMQLLEQHWLFWLQTLPTGAHPGFAHRPLGDPAQKPVQHWLERVHDRPFGVQPD